MAGKKYAIDFAMSDGSVKTVEFEVPLAELVGALMRDGTTPMEANLPMGGFRVTGVGAPAADGDAVNLEYADEHYRHSDWTPSAADVGARPNTWMPSADDVGARPNTWMPSAADVGARPNTWMPSAADVGARPNTWMPTAADVGAAPANLAEYTPYGAKDNFCTNPLMIDFDINHSVNRTSVISTEDASTIANSPVTSGAFYAYREVFLIDSTVGRSPKVIVKLTESYPQAGRIWIISYNPDTGAWDGGWKEYNSDIFRKARPYNLLDNSDFINPVNQREYVNGSNIPAYTYFLDRWRASSADATATLDSGGITLTNTIYQTHSNFHRYVGKIVTFAIGFADGTVECGSATVTNNADWTVLVRLAHGYFTNSTTNVWEVFLEAGKKIAWVALYEGEYTTGNLPQYHPKGYAAEWAECRRYYRHRVRMKAVVTHSDYYDISYMHDMRIAPTVTPIQFDVFGKDVISDFTDCTVTVTTVDLSYAKLPTVATHSYTAGSLMASLNADL